MRGSTYSWPDWRTVREIGSGGFGTVYEIEKDTAGFVEKAALKIVSIPESDSDIEDYRLSGYDDESIRRRYLEALSDVVHEYRVMKELKGCPTIVICDDVQTVQHEDGIGWDVLIKMELLTPLMKTLGKEVSDDQVIRIGKDLCAALMECERRGVLHRDIKPQNIFVSENGTYKLGDFGIAKAVEKTTRGTQSGTYRYMAPEVYHNEPYGSKADIYSLGLVLYWLLNERHEPFVPINNRPPTTTEEDTARMRRLTKEMAGKYLPAPKNGSEALKRIVCKACAYDPNDRYQSAADFRDALEDAESQTVGVWPVPPPVPPTPPTPPIWKWIGIGAAIVAVITSIILLILRKPSAETTAENTPVPTETVAVTPTPEPTPTAVTGIIFTNYNYFDSPYGIVLGNEVSINAEVEPSDAEGEIEWSSSDDKIANVDANGRFVAAYPGQVTITATCGGVSQSCTFNVYLRENYTLDDLTNTERAYFLTYVKEQADFAKEKEDQLEIAPHGDVCTGYFLNGKLLYVDVYQGELVFGEELLKTIRVYFDESSDSVYLIRETIEETGFEAEYYYYNGMMFRIIGNGTIYDYYVDGWDYWQDEFYDQYYNLCKQVQGDY